MNRAILAASPLLLVASCVKESKVEKPNIVMLFVDDLGWADLGYQNPIFETPNINKLKAEGLYFERNYVPTATSSPSRATLLTGKQALRCGFVRHIYEPKGKETDQQRSEFQTLASDPGNMKSRAWLQHEEITYAERLKEFGYYNYFIGKWHLGHEAYYPTTQGFDASFGSNEHGHPSNYYNVPFFKTQNPFSEMGKDAYLTEVLTDGAVDFIQSYDKEQPFLLNFWYYTVHSPHFGKKEYVEKYMAAGMDKPLANYAAMVRSLDDSVGRILAALKESGKADNTMVVFVSDQGGSFPNGVLRGGKKGGDTLAEGGSRVPMIIYYPKAKGMGMTYSKPVSTTDIYPTLIELASGRECQDTQIDGVSLLPIINGGEQEDRTIYLFRSYEDQNSAIIEGDWKLIKYRSGKRELYNIREDISERNNLAGIDVARADDMLHRLLEWEAEATPQYLLH
ncbi:MAG: sulfatase [Rikenellaceae bacterium]